MTVLLVQFLLFSGIFYLSYRICFSRLSFFGLNRVLLLIIPGLSLLIPLSVPYLGNFMLSPGPSSSWWLPVVELNNSTEIIEDTGIGRIGWIIFLAGLILRFSILLKAWRRVVLIDQKAAPLTANIRFSDQIQEPFAFFDKIFIPEKFRDKDHLSTIIAHERAHLRQRHSYDNLYYSILSSFFWFNPFFYFLHRQLRLLHEYQADRLALEHTSLNTYARMLLHHALGENRSWQPASRFFNSSLTKTRITMMYKNATPRKWTGLYALLLPLIVSMAVFSCQKQEGNAASDSEVKDSSAPVSFTEVDQMPLFDQCDGNASRKEQANCFQNTLMQQVQENFEYPELAKDKELEGRIYIQFIIDENGQAGGAEIRASRFPEDADASAVQRSEEAALSVIKSLSPIKPAEKAGQIVPLEFTIPIQMKLPD